MKKIIKNVITILMIFTITFVFSDLTARAEYCREEQKAISQANKLLKACKKYDINKIRKYVVNRDDVLHIKEPRISKYIKKSQRKYFKYSITGARVSGKYAYVDVSFSNFDSYFMGEMFLKDWLDKKLKNKSWDANKNFTPMLVNYYKDYLKNDGAEEYLWEDTYTLKFKKVGKTWKLAKNNAKLFDLMDGGLINSFRKFVKSPIRFYFS